MSYEITKVVKGEEVHFKKPTAEFYEAVGGEEGMRKLMYDFYDIIYESDIANFFPQDEEEFEKVKEKNTKFFIQLCGGPKVYEGETEGMELNEYMIRLHDDFSIYEKSRYEWLGCMEEALRKVDMEQRIKDDFWAYLESFSKLTVNTFSDGSIYYAAYTPDLEEK
ncbi:MAG: globin [Sulfurovum sp. FS06-10]|jgi:hemoglobin|nr:MAG: globin [Sulfurovum sp. FS06-10]